MASLVLNIGSLPYGSRYPCWVVNLCLLCVQFSSKEAGCLLTNAYLSRRCHACSNMKPVKVLLEERACHPRSGIFSIFPYLPWEASSKVAVESRFSLSSPAGSRATTRSFQLDPELNRILNFPPLLKAFSDFCQKALCNEVSGHLTWLISRLWHTCLLDRRLYPGVEYHLVDYPAHSHVQ